MMSRNVSPREADWSVVKVSQIASFKITRKRECGRGGGGGGVEGGGGLGQGGDRTKWKINISFSKFCEKYRPIKTWRSERVPLQIVSLKTPKMSSHFECRAKHSENEPLKSTHLKDFRINRIKRPKLNQQRNSLTNRWRKTRNKTKLVRRPTMLGIFISRSAARWLFSIVIGRNCSLESLQTAVQPPLVWLKTASVFRKKFRLPFTLRSTILSVRLMNWIIVHLTKCLKSVSALSINILPNNVAPLGIFSLLNVSRKKNYNLMLKLVWDAFKQSAWDSVTVTRLGRWGVRCGGLI